MLGAVRRQCVLVKAAALRKRAMAVQWGHADDAIRTARAGGNATALRSWLSSIDKLLNDPGVLAEIKRRGASDMFIRSRGRPGLSDVDLPVEIGRPKWSGGGPEGAHLPTVRHVPGTRTVDPVMRQLSPPWPHTSAEASGIRAGDKNKYLLDLEQLRPFAKDPANRAFGGRKRQNSSWTMPDD
jgi:hypothetical protein